MSQFLAVPLKMPHCANMHLETEQICYQDSSWSCCSDDHTSAFFFKPLLGVLRFAHQQNLELRIFYQPQGRTADHRKNATQTWAAAPCDSGHPSLLLLQEVISHKSISDLFVALPERPHPITTPLMSSSLLCPLRPGQMRAVRSERLSSAEIKCGLRYCLLWTCFWL